MSATSVPPHRAVLLAAAAALCLGSGPGRAEKNRLLPFWGQPFPSGFTRGEVVYPMAGPAAPYAIPWRCHGPSPFRRPGRCPVVLHARD